MVTLPLYTIAWWLHNVFSAGAVCGPHYSWVGREHSEAPSHTSLCANEKRGLTGEFSHWIISDSRETQSLRLMPCCKGNVLLTSLPLVEPHSRVVSLMFSCELDGTQLAMENRPEMMWKMCMKWMKICMKPCGITLKVSDWIRIDSHHAAGIGQMLKEDCNLLLQRTNFKIMILTYEIY